MIADINAPARESGAGMVDSATDWIWRQYDESASRFRLSPESPFSPVGSSCAVLACETLGGLATWPSAEVTRVTGSIQECQRADGWFEDPLLIPCQSSIHDAAYLLGHATFLAMMALDALGGSPRRRLKFLDEWRDDDRVYAWMDGLDWTNPWRESNWVEWIGYWLLADAGLTARDVPIQEESWPRGFSGLMVWLEKHQDSGSGMWGNPPSEGLTRSLHLAAGAYHHYVFYYATGRPIRRIEAIVDRVLALQQADGLFAPGRVGGGSCEDLDAVDILANMHRLADYRRSDIEQALERALAALVANQRPTGAFVDAFDPNLVSSTRTGVRGLVSAIFPLAQRMGVRDVSRRVGPDARGELRNYAGCQRLPYRRTGGDMFSQWFRPLAIAIAASVLGRDRSPVWWPFGFRRQVSQGWWPGMVGKEQGNP